MADDASSERSFTQRHPSVKTIHVESAGRDTTSPSLHSALSSLSAFKLNRIYKEAAIDMGGGPHPSCEAEREVVRDLSGRVMVGSTSVGLALGDACSTTRSLSPALHTTHKNIDKSIDLNMKVWPQVLLCMVVSLGHLILGTVLAYPAIALPPLTAPASHLYTLSHTNTTLPYRLNTEIAPDMFSSKTVPTTTATVTNSSLYEAKEGGDGMETPDSEELMATTSPAFFPHIYLQPQQAAWFASLHSMGGVMGSVVCGPLMASVGQRRAILFMTPIILASWIVTWGATSVYLLLLTRVVAGMCIGVLGTSGQVYMVESAHESLRGSLTCATDLYVSFGLLLTYGLGACELGWRWSALILGVTTTVPLTVGLFFFPDSPRYLALKGRKEDARKALQFLRGHNYDITQELEKILKMCNNNTQSNVCEQLSSLRNTAVHTPFLTSCGVFILVQMAGQYVIYSYSVIIFQEANTGLSAYISTVVVGMARLLGSCVGVVVVERAGRRSSLMAGGVGEALALSALGIYFHMKNSAPNSVYFLSWLPLLSLVVYTVILGATLSPIPFLLSSELLPLSFRSVGSAASKSVFFIGGLVVAYSFPVLAATVGLAVTFWGYAASCLLLVALVWWAVPETKGRTLEQIEEYYYRKFK